MLTRDISLTNIGLFCSEFLLRKIRPMETYPVIS